MIGSIARGSTLSRAVICRVTGVSGRPALRTTSTVGSVVPGVSKLEGYDPATTWYPDTGDLTVGSLVKRSLTVAAPTLLPCMQLAGSERSCSSQSYIPIWDVACPDMRPSRGARRADNVVCISSR